MKMTTKKKNLYIVQEKPKAKKLVIDQNKINRAKADHSVNFRTGGYMTEKDRPRKKYRVNNIKEEDE